MITKGQLPYLFRVRYSQTPAEDPIEQQLDPDLPHLEPLRAQHPCLRRKPPVLTKVVVNFQHLTVHSASQLSSKQLTAKHISPPPHLQPPHPSHPLPNPKSTVTTPTKHAGWPTLNDLAQAIFPSGTVSQEALRMGKYRVKKLIFRAVLKFRMSHQRGKYCGILIIFETKIS